MSEQTIDMKNVMHQIVAAVPVELAREALVGAAFVLSGIGDGQIPHPPAGASPLKHLLTILEACGVGIVACESKEAAEASAEQFRKFGIASGVGEIVLGSPDPSKLN